MPAQRENLGPIIDRLVTDLSIKEGPEAPAGVIARKIDEHHVLYLNLDGQPKAIKLAGKLKSILRDKEYADGFTLGAYDAEFVEIEE